MRAPLTLMLVLLSACSPATDPEGDPMLVEPMPDAAEAVVDMAASADMAREVDLAEARDLAEPVDLTQPLAPGWDLAIDPNNPLCRQQQPVYPNCYYDADCGGDECRFGVPCSVDGMPYRNGQCCSRRLAYCDQGMWWTCCKGLTCNLAKHRCE